MFRKIFFALTLLFIGIISVAFCSSGVSALELDHNSEIYKKIIRQNIKACYKEEPLYSKVFPKDWPNDEFYGLFGDALWVSMPTGYTPLEDNFVTCKGLIYGDKIGNGAKGEYAGILNLYGKDISGTTGLEKKKKLAVGLGYEEDSNGGLDNPDAPLYYALSYTYTTYSKVRDDFFDLFDGYDESYGGPYDAATYVTGTKINDDGKVASKLEIFASGNGTNLEEAGIDFKENGDKTGGKLSIKCEDFNKSWGETFNDVLIGIANFSSSKGFDCINGELSVSYNETIWNDGDVNNGSGASGNSVVGFLNKHLPLNFYFEHESTCCAPAYLNYSYTKKTFTATGTISSDPNYVGKPTNITLPGQYRKIGSWDDRAVKGMEYFTGGTNRIFTDAEIYILYAGYLTDYYKADFQCGADKAEYYAGRQGYVRASNLLYDGQMQDECYVKAVENADKKVNGVSLYNFNGADRGGGMVFHGQKTFEELLAQIADLNTTPESIAEANIVVVDDEGAQSEPDPCYENSGSLGWVLCPILDKVSEALDGLYTNAVEPFLVVNPELVSSNSGTYNAWQVMIGIANILVVIFLLVVIFSQLTGIGIDNYGIKKVLPKIIAAAILVNLSYIICQLAVDLSNILGNSLNSFLSNIEVSGLNSSLSLDGVSTGIQVSSNNAAWFKGLFTVAGGGLVGVGIAALAMSVVNSGWFAGLVLPILLFFVVALVAVLFFFILLGVRKAGVVILVVLAPLAFVCYMLPNTKKWFDKWLKAFEGLLLLYPICGLLIGGGQLVSKILLTVSDDYIMYFTGCIVLVVPFFFIPTLLKGSFVAMGNIGAKISGFGKALGARGRGRLDGAVRGSNWFKSHQAEIARQNQERTASRTVRRLNAKRDRNGGELNARDTRRLARSQESLDKLQREDRVARTVLSESEFAKSTMPELQTAWEEAFDSGDTERLDALTNVLTMKYGSGGARFIGDALSRKRVVTGVDASGRQTVNQNYVRSLRALQDNMNHNSNFAGNMKNKASDAYAMISNAGMYHNDATGQNEYRDLSYFSAKNNISTDLKDWSTQSASTLQRAIDSGALSDEMVESLLSSTDPSIQSGIQSDAGKRDVLQARMYNMAHNPSGVGPSLPAGTAAQQYRAEQARTQNENELFISHERDAERIGKTTITVSPGSVITGAPAVTFEGYAVPAGFNTGGSAPVRNADGHWIYKDSSTNREWNATTGRYMPPSTP